jgi:cold shock CspA family protein
MADPFESVDHRERGTVVAWDPQAGVGHIHADSGDTVFLALASIVRGYRLLRKGQRVEFARMGYGLTPRLAANVVVLGDNASPH